MNYLDTINKYRSDDISDHQKNIACWAPFQAMHINKKGRIKPCPFSFPGVELKHYQIQWSPKKSLKECWNDTVYEEMRNASFEGSLLKYCKYCIKQCKEDKPPSSLDYDWVGGPRNISHEYPQEIELELSNKCNYMCDACGPWCSSQWAEKLGLKDDERFKSNFDNKEYLDAFVKDLKTFIHKIYRINFTGGEPFAQPAVYSIIKMIEEESANIHVHFTTNGSVMNGSVKKLVKRPNTSFTVSLDSINRKMYPKIRVNGNYDNVMNNIDYLIKHCPEVGASFVITKKNVRELPDIVNWCNKKNILFSYHILENMGFRNWEKELQPISVEHEDKNYLAELKHWLISFRPESDNTEISKKNLQMYEQYIERLQ